MDWSSSGFGQIHSQLEIFFEERLSGLYATTGLEMGYVEKDLLTNSPPHIIFLVYLLILSNIDLVEVDI